MLPVPEKFVVDPPTVFRRRPASPLVGVTKILKCLAFAARPSRIITPAFAQAFVLVRLVTRATICPSPASG